MDSGVLRGYKDCILAIHYLRNNKQFKDKDYEEHSLHKDSKTIF